MIKLKDILLEIGDSSATSYDWEHTIQNKKGASRFKGIIPKDEQFWHDQYDFQTESGLIYIVTVNKKLVRGDKSPTASISFEASEGDWEKTTHGDTFTRGEMYRVMATIMEITKSYIENNPNLQTLSMNPVKNYENDERRKKLYLVYIKKNIPANASVEEVGDKIEINFS
jgi:hypothetical protein